MKGEIGFVFLLILLMFVFKDFGRPEKTIVYEAYCADRTKSAADCPATTAGPRIEFQTIPSSQSVLSLEDGEAYRLQECTVFDAKNWSCAHPGLP